jgi:SAM-dependent methyltransferase
MTDSSTSVTSGPDNRVAQHYRTLLAAHYTWMLGGDIEATARDQKTLLNDLLLSSGAARRGVAVDLGCGPGAQTLALADLGYDPVIAVDTDPTLLAELDTHADNRPAIRTAEGGAVAAAVDLEPGSVAVAVCMGDTLLHLSSADAVTDMFTAVARALQPGGALLLTYRALVDELHGTDRFIPVRSDPDRVMLCFLEFASPDVVEVHDVVHTRTPNGWTMTASSYPKLRLSPSWVTDQLTAAGLEVGHHEQSPSGMWHTLGRRP